MTQQAHSTEVVYRNHSRAWRSFRFVYPVISRRAGGLSIGVNLNPDKACSFACAYCQVDRSTPPTDRAVDFSALDAELRALLANPDQIFEDDRFRDVPDDLRSIRDIAFSGDGEPTASPAFPAAAGLVAELRGQLKLNDAKIVVFTNGCYLRRPAVIQALAFLDAYNGEYWIKLDAGTQEYFERVNGAKLELDELLEGVLATARVRPIIIQSMFMRIDDQPPSPAEISAYAKRLRRLLDDGGQIKSVQVYTVARRTAQPNISALSRKELATIADAVRETDIPAECFV